WWGGRRSMAGSPSSLRSGWSRAARWWWRSATTRAPTSGRCSNRGSPTWRSSPIWPDGTVWSGGARRGDDGGPRGRSGRSGLAHRSGGGGSPSARAGQPGGVSDRDGLRDRLPAGRRGGHGQGVRGEATPVGVEPAGAGEQRRIRVGGGPARSAGQATRRSVLARAGDARPAEDRAVQRLGAGAKKGIDRRQGAGPPPVVIHPGAGRPAG